MRNAGIIALLTSLLILTAGNVMAVEEAKYTVLKKQKEIPAYLAAAIRYSGAWSEKAYNKHLSELLEWMESENLKALEDLVWARYNATFTPWFMRRNEILIPIAP